MAVNVTLVPAHIAPAGAALILTLAGSNGLTVIVIAVDDAGEPVAQVAVDVIRTDMASPFDNVVDVYVAPVSPAIGVTPLYH